MAEPLDVIIVGAGSAGLSALRQVRKKTERFTIINAEPWGTTCARVGCMPSKALIASANAFHRRHAFADLGIGGAEALTIDVPAVLARVRRLRDHFVSGVLQTTRDLGERAITGRARLLAPDRVTVDGRELRARRIILATGSRPFVPPAWRALGDRLITSDDLFERTDLPARLAVVGLGPIGIELAQALSRLGVEVVAFDQGDRLAGITDPEVAAAAAELLRDEFPVHFGDTAEPEPRGDEVRVRAGEVEITVDGVVAALGRHPNLDDIGLESLGVPLNDRGVPPVDPNTQQIADLPVFLAGDANGHIPLLHEAADEGFISGWNATAPDLERFKRRVPLVIVFSDPNIALVGQRFADLDPTRTVVGEVRFQRQGRARVDLQDKGMLRIYAERADGRLLGAELCAPSGEHLAHLLSLALSQSSTVDDLLRIPFYHPVLEEGLRSALRQLARQLPREAVPDLARCDALEAEALD